MNLDIQTVFYATLGGAIPALLWLWFWNREDKKNPEPKSAIVFTFLVGMLTVPIVIPIQKLALSFFISTNIVVFVWAAIEEVTKFAMAYFAILWKDVVDEPIDAIIYMLTVALGFAAVENTLFLIDPVSNSGVLDSILTGNFRFLGATLLHVLTSSIIGVAIAFSFYAKRYVKIIATVFGVILAVTLHTLFNFLILNSASENLLRVFVFVWIGLVFLMLAFEKVKKIKKFN